MSYFRSTGRGGTRADLVAVIVVLIFGVVVSSLPPGEQARIVVTMRSSVLLPVLELHRVFEERARLQDRFDRLRAERDSLASRLVAGRRLAQAGRQLRLMAELGALEELEFVPADLVPGRPRVGDSNVFMLRGPELARVRPPVGVFTGEGVVGVVRAADRTGALGEFWTHPDFRLSVETVMGGITGIVRAVRGDDGQPVMLLEGAPFQEAIPNGTLLVTTGLAGVYPPGLPVGTVRELAGQESGWMKRYTVDPAVRPEGTDIVLVWRRPSPDTP